MKYLFSVTLCLFSLLKLDAQNPKIEVLVLGTTHFFNIKDDSISSPQKREDLKRVLNDLKSFNPQQIFIESPASADSFWLDAYKVFQKDNKESTEKWLINSEIYQIGMKLAALLKLPNGVQGIDWTDPDTRDTTLVFNTKHEQAYFNFIKELRTHVIEKKGNPEDDRGLKLYEDIQKQLMPYYGFNKAVRLNEMFKTLNTPENLKKMYYSNRLGDLVINTAGVGAELNGLTGFRDFKIYRNALSRLDKKTQRVLIIYGVSHAHIQRELFGLDPRFKVVNVAQFIK
jgi:hypothetical protein